MTMLIVSFILFVIVVMVMSIGVIAGRKPITGSCGGISAVLEADGDGCSICGKKFKDQCLRREALMRCEE